jgi:hypothetical protein
MTYGTGLAMSMQAYGTSGDGMVAAVMIAPDGRLTVRSDAVDMGNGSATTLGVVVGPILGANAETVDMGCYLLFGQTGLTTFPTTPNWPDPKWTARVSGPHPPASRGCIRSIPCNRRRWR